MLIARSRAALVIGGFLLAVSTARSAELRASITALIDGPDTALGTLSEVERSELKALYRPDYAPVWLDAASRPSRNMRDALTVLSHAADEGLDPSDYDAQDLVTAPPSGLEMASPGSQDLARLDVALSLGMVRYLRDVHLGRVVPESVGYRLHVPHDPHDFGTLIRAAISGQRVTGLAAELQPPLAQYRLLRSMLVRYRSLAADPSFIAPPSLTRAIRPGEFYRDAGVLQDELVALGDLPADVPSTRESRLYVGAIVEGVKRFQARHGLDSDGVLGRATIAALRVPPSRRVRQMELSLERLRWLPHLGDERILGLNIPMFRLWAWDTIPPDGAPLFGMDVIVGRALSTQTPVFIEEMRSVVFRPYWNVPRSILRHEVLPAIQQDPGYLRRENLEIVRGAGDDATHVDPTPDALRGLEKGELRVRQRPGPRNALGLIKFVFPNHEDVYMHGTPAQTLFARSRRDFSHGCVRVADPVALAEWVLRDRPEWTRDRIIAATRGVRTVHVTLPRRIQVVLFYTTAAVMPETGTIHFAEDLYRHDVRLERALAARGRTKSPDLPGPGNVPLSTR